jgi:hypothetical protein
MAPIPSSPAGRYWDRTAGSDTWAITGNRATENFVNADPGFHHPNPRCPLWFHSPT